MSGWVHGSKGPLRIIKCKVITVSGVEGFRTLESVCKLLSSPEGSTGEGTQCGCFTVCASMVPVMLDPHSVLDI